MSGEQSKYMRRLVNVTAEDGYKVIRHLSCGHRIVRETLFGEADALAAQARQLIEARRLVGVYDYCSQCAAEQEQQG